MKYGRKSNTLSLPLDFLQIFKRLVSSQSSFALLAIDTSYQTYLCKKKENPIGIAPVYREGWM